MRFAVVNHEGLQVVVDNQLAIFDNAAAAERFIATMPAEGYHIVEVAIEAIP